MKTILTLPLRDHLPFSLGGYLFALLVKYEARQWDPSEIVVIVFFTTMWEKIKPFSLKNSPKEVKITKFIKLQPFSTGPFKGLCEEMGSTHVSLLLHTEIQGCLEEKHLCYSYKLN